MRGPSRPRRDLRPGGARGGEAPGQDRRPRVVARCLALVCCLAAVSAGAPASGRGGVPVPEPAQLPLALVPLPGGWFAGRDPVTQGQYAEVTGENPSHFPGDNERPVESVSWEDAVAFCAQLTARERAAGRLPPGWRYDLPTDAQWDAMLGDADLRTAVTSLAAPRESPVAVADAGPPNRLGLRGMLGNVWQWCRDWYDEGIRRRDSNPDVPAGAVVKVPGVPDGSPDDPPDERYKVLRGGAWDTGPSAGFTPRARLRYAPGMGNARTGFRCVLESSEGSRVP